MRFLYNCFIYAYKSLINLASLFNSKAKLWINGRKNIFEKLEQRIKPGEKIIWFHCASLGEFEQGRPLIERLKTQDSRLKTLLTFFSPSGYEIRKNYEGADYIFYLPADTPANAKKFLSITKPHLAFFIKYEFWFNYLSELKKNNTPTFLVSGILRNDHYFFKWYGAYFKKQLSCFTHFFLQDENSKKLLEQSGFTNTTVSGDTRFDRVYELKSKVKKIDLIEKFKGDSKLLIAGSTWEEDEQLLAQSLKEFKIQGLKFNVVIVPHEIHESHINHVENLFQDFNPIRFTKADVQNISDKNVLIVDTIGILSSIYQYGHVAFIGGGFTKGIHNILEASTFGLPVLFGPNYHKFNEANDLIKINGAFCIHKPEELNKKLEELFNDSKTYEKASGIAAKYVNDNKGATDTVYNYIKSYI